MDPSGAVSASNLLGVLGVVVGLLGIAIAIFYARRGSRLVFYQEGSVVLEARPDEDLAVLWKERPVPVFTKSVIWVWNAGGATLDGSALVPGYPLRLELGAGVDEAELLTARVLAHSRPEIQFAISIDAAHPRALSLSFDYLDHGDGAIIEVLHTSRSWRVAPGGTLKGHRHALCERFAQTPYVTVRAALPGCLVAVGMFIAPLIVDLVRLPHLPPSDWTLTAVLCPIGLLIGGLFSFQLSRGPSSGVARK